MKIISWCLYIDVDHARTEDTLLRLPEYLMGLKMNVTAAACWFPDWELRLYADETSLKREPLVWDLVREAVTDRVKVIPCRPGRHPMTERYRPLVEEVQGVCVVRDVDSILSLTDAQLVSRWMEDDSSDVLQYKEKDMQEKTMGGGVAVKMGGLTLRRPDTFAVTKLLGRGSDEPALCDFLRSTANNTRFTTVRTRMTNHGVYCIDSVDTTRVPDTFDGCTILWTVPFYDRCNGYFSFHSVPISDIVSHVQNTSASEVHLYSHWRHYKHHILDDTAWFR